jgi:hypothetical protein
MPSRQQRRVATLPTDSRSDPGVRPSRRELCLSACVSAGSQPPGGSERRNAGPLPWGPDPEARPFEAGGRRPEAENVPSVRKRRPKAENRGVCCDA